MRFWVCPSGEGGPFFLQLSVSPVHKFHWPPNSDILVVHPSSAGLLGWGAHCGVQNPCFLGRTSAIVIIPQFLSHLPGVMGLDRATSLPLLPILLWL